MFLTISSARLARVAHICFSHQNKSACLALRSTAEVATALAPHPLNNLIKRCSDVGVSVRANVTKLFLAGQLVSHAASVLEKISSPSCSAARTSFAADLGFFTRIVLRPMGVPVEELRVPWHVGQIHTSDLLASLDQLTVVELREILGALEIKVPRSTRKGGLTFLVLERFETTLSSYLDLDDAGLRDWITSFYGHCPPADFTRADLLLTALDFLFPQECLSVLMTCPYPTRNPTARVLRQSRDTKLTMLSALRRRLLNGAVKDYWPLPIPAFLKLSCMSAYHRATQFRPAKPCAACGRARVDLHVETFLYADGSGSGSAPNLEPLRCDDAWLLEHPQAPFEYLDPSLNGLMLDGAGLVHHSRHETAVNLCDECLGPLRHGRFPKLSYKNGLFRGYLPPELQDLNWVEERVCALYRVTANISRIFGSSNPKLPFVLYGNTCAHPQNVVDTAKVLPRTAGDVADHIGVMFVGPGKYKAKSLDTFRVRRAKLIAFMNWLRLNNRLYRDVPYDESRFDEYPVDGPLPGIESRLVHDDVPDPDAEFAKETSGLEPHPAQTGKRLELGQEFVFMDALGITNSSADTIGARTFEAAALANLLPLSMRTPDLTLHRGSSAVSEYGNDKLFPGLYPTLFPYGIGGLEDWAAQSEKGHVSFRLHANYLIDLRTRRFSAHPEFMFVVVNILQRRAVHLETRFRLRTSRVEAIAPELLALTPDQIQRVADQLGNNASYSSIAAVDRPVLDLLKIVEMVAAKVPGSHSSKQALRRQIFAMCRHYGVPQIYMTLNPNPVHSPLFHLMAGDESVDLLDRYPRVSNSIERALRVAGDPATAAYFYQLSVKLILEHLLGWDFEKGCSKPDGGILGHVEAFAMSDELTNRGRLHGHMVIWVRGGLNPAPARARLAADNEFQDRFFKFWDEAILHHLPDVDFTKDSEVNPRQERPPQPPAFAEDLYRTRKQPTPEQVSELKEWDEEFAYEVKRMGEETQRHSHGDVCTAYKFKGTCRFQFPHQIVPESYYDFATNSIYLRCLDEWVNYFNPEILVMARHNHDIKCILSGKAAQAAVYYITNYITKLDVNTYHVLSMMSQAAYALNKQQLPPGQTVELRTLLHKCLARITREQQLHAQKAAQYIRGNGDSLVSHKTVPLMTGLLMQYVQKLYMNDEAVDEELEGDEHDVQVDVNTNDVPVDDVVPGEPPEELDPSQDIQLSDDGHLEVYSQLDDYLFRGDSLKRLNMYDFVRLLRLVPRKGKSDTSPRRFKLDPRHPRSQTHILEYRSADGTGPNALEFVPMALGPAVPRKGPGNYYRLFTLAHFKPFSADVPLIPPGTSIAQMFVTHQFDEAAQRRMENWEALHECEDERDAERLRKQASKVSDRTLPYALGEVDEDGFTVDPALIPTDDAQKSTYAVWTTLFEAGWFVRREAENQQECELRSLTDKMDAAALRRCTTKWRTAIRVLESNKDAMPVACSEDARTTLAPAAEGPSIEPRTEGLATSRGENLTFELAAQYADKYTLNAAQRRAYSVCIRWLLAYIAEPGTVARPKPPPLRMILHGPGGTGKTHSLLPIEDVLGLAKLSDAVVRIAPTGTAASLINGQTLHSAIKLKVKRHVDDTVETFEVTWTPSDRKQMQDLFGNAILVLLDEFSLASAKMLGQLDTALRMVKQNWDEHFGGMSVILSGDLCQYPPVGETALWVPLSDAAPKNKKDISLERLGRLAYKTFDTVIEFTEQQRMKADPVFGDAVRRLRTRECTPDDVLLFNTRAVKTEHRPQGVDLESERFTRASIITTDNHTRSVINEQKAKALGSHLPRYFDVAADDRIKDGSPIKTLTRESRRRVLDMVSKDPRNKLLPGRLKLYEGMPVILRQRNLSTPLKVTNGAQGVLRELSIRKDVHGETIADAALVEFPNSNIHIPGLPPRCYPIFPMSCSMVAPMVDPESRRIVPVKLSRRQLPIEAAFSVTGHSAQGKTLPVVVCDPSVKDAQRGFYIYVSFSRAQNLASLALLSEVSLKILNTPLAPKLKFELRRLAALAHNTGVRAGDIAGASIEVPEPETEKKQRRVAVVRDTGDPVPVLGKRSQRDEAELQSRKKRRTGDTRASASDAARAVEPVPLATTTESALFAGPQWDSVDWSCAYDSALVVAFACWSTLSGPNRRAWAAHSPFTSYLGAGLNRMEADPLNSSLIGTLRNQLRDRLSAIDLSLARRGPVLADINSVLQQFFGKGAGVSCLVMHSVQTCSTCDRPPSVRSFQVPLLLAVQNAAVPVLLDEWIDEELVRQSCNILPHDNPCCSHSVTSLQPDEAPAVLYFEVDPSCTVYPSLLLKIGSGGGEVSYAFAGGVYLSGNGSSCGHFKAAVSSGGSVFSYDGVRVRGALERSFPLSDGPRGLSRMGDSGACAYVYRRSAL